MENDKDQGAAVRGEAVAEAFNDAVKYGTGTYVLNPDGTTRHVSHEEMYEAPAVSARAADAPSEPSESTLNDLLNEFASANFDGGEVDASDDAGMDALDASVKRAHAARKGIVDLFESRAADALDSQPTDRTRHIAEWDSAADLLESQAAISAEEKETVSVCAAVLRRVARTGLCRDKSQPTVAAQQGSIADDARRGIIELAARIFDFKPHKQTLEVNGKYFEFAFAVLDNFRAPVAPIAPDGWISVKDRLPAPSVPVMVWQPRTTMNHPDDILINFDCIDPEDDDANTWQGHNNWRDDVACIAKPPGSIVPPHDAPYTHWQHIPADPQQEGSEAGNG